ncbi:MAG: cell wall-binding repeat-containing protein [Clostridiaceae bacterium]
MLKKFKLTISVFLIPLLLIVLFAVPAPVSAASPSQLVYSKSTPYKAIALTFDGCTDISKFTSIVNTLKANNIKATFFPIAKYAENSAVPLKAAFNNGNEIGNHTYSHPYLTTLSYDAIRSEISSAGAAIESVTGEFPTLFRPPYFDYNSTVLQAAGDEGYSKTIICSIDPIDWNGKPAAEVTSIVLNKAAPGAIVLLHTDSVSNTSSALQNIIDGLRAKGYCFLTVSQLLDYYPSITPVRYGGLDRFETAVKVSQGGWSNSDNVILVNGLDFPDAMAGVPLAYIKNAPILLTYATTLPSSTMNEISRLGAKNIYILGGSGVVSDTIASDLTGKGYNVFRYSGADRFETATDAATQVLDSSSSKTAVIATAYNYPDALSISPYAAMNKFPILYTEQSILTPTTKNFLAEKGITKVIIPGLYGAVSLSVENELKSMGITIQRTGGSDRYSTSFNIANTFASSFGNDVIIATGEDFPDALSGGALAAKKGIPILLVYNNYIIPQSEAYIHTNETLNLYVVGGTGVISNNLINDIMNN